MNDHLGFPVELPAGGTMHLLTEEEVDLFQQSAQRYQEDYNLTKLNDLALVGAICTQQIILFRAQQRISGLEPEYEDGVPTGRYKRVEKQKATDLSSAQTTITKSADQIREIEKALGLDKKTRESGGEHTVANYIDSLKKAAHQFGIRIAERVKEYEKVMMEARWKIRLLQNGDAEDLAYHDLTPEKFIDWLGQELADIEVNDKTWARQKGKVYVGKL